MGAILEAGYPKREAELAAEIQRVQRICDCQVEIFSKHLDMYRKPKERSILEIKILELLAYRW